MILSPHNKMFLAKYGVRGWHRKPGSTTGRQAIRRAQRKRDRQLVDRQIACALNAWDRHTTVRTVELLLDHIEHTPDPLVTRIKTLLQERM